jgi:hypothetical protein
LLDGLTSPEMTPASVCTFMVHMAGKLHDKVLEPFPPLDMLSPPGDYPRTSSIPAGSSAGLAISRVLRRLKIH